MCGRDDDPTTYDSPLPTSTSGSDGMGTVRSGSMSHTTGAPGSSGVPGATVAAGAKAVFPIDRSGVAEIVDTAARSRRSSAGLATG